MKIIRDIQKGDLSKFSIAALTILFVFSLSFHNHSFASHTEFSIDAHTSSGHSVGDCSACLLQGNLQPPKTEHSFNNSYLGQFIATISIEFVVPSSFINLDRPSRAPPCV